MFKTFSVLVCTLAMTLAAGSQAIAKDPLLDQQSLPTNFMESYLSNLDLSPEQEQKFPAKLMAKLNLQTGRTFDLEFRNPSNDPQTNLDIIDAVASIGVLPIPYAYRTDGGAPLQFELGVGKPFNKISVVNSRYHHDIQANEGACIFHSIPLSVLRRYPGKFTYKELSEAAHIRQIATSNATVETVEKLREPWIRFFEANPTASRNSILKMEKKVDSQFKTFWLSTPKT